MMKSVEEEQIVKNIFLDDNSVSPVQKSLTETQKSIFVLTPCAESFALAGKGGIYLGPKHIKQLVDCLFQVHLFIVMYVKTISLQ